MHPLVQAAVTLLSAMAPATSASTAARASVARKDSPEELERATLLGVALFLYLGTHEFFHEGVARRCNAHPLSIERILIFQSHGSQRHRPVARQRILRRAIHGISDDRQFCIREMKPYLVSPPSNWARLYQSQIASSLQHLEICLRVL